MFRNESKIRDLDDQKGAAIIAEAQRYNQESLNKNIAEHLDIVKGIKEPYTDRVSRVRFNESIEETLFRQSQPLRRT